MDHQDSRSVSSTMQETESTKFENHKVCIIQTASSDNKLNESIDWSVVEGGTHTVKKENNTTDFEEKKDAEAFPGEKPGIQAVEQVADVSAVTVLLTPDGGGQLRKGSSNTADGRVGGNVLSSETQTKRCRKSQRQEEMMQRRRSLRRVRDDDLADLHVQFGDLADDSSCKNENAPRRTKRKGKSPQSRVKKSEEVDPPAGRGRGGRKRRVTLCQVDIGSDVLEQWRVIGTQRGLHNDADIAALLVQHYQATDGSEPCALCKSPLRLLCPQCPAPPPPVPCSPTTTTTTSTPAVPCRPPLPSSSPLRSLAEMKTEEEEEGGGENAAEMEDAEVEPLPSESQSEEPVKQPRKRGRKRKGERQSHVCSECGATFVRAAALKIHIRKHTGEKPFSCEECDRAFTTSGQLVNHRRKHTGERPYVCHICNATFPIASSLKQHSRIHTGDRPYVCHVCQLRFSYRGDLTAHVRKHTGDRPFLCSDCGKSFAMSSHLSKHKRIHSGYRPFECEICHKTFPFLNRLTLHMRTHTGEKPFLCADCGSSFIRASTLTIHRRIHHTFEKPCICPFCNHAFADSANLSKHKKYKHGAHKMAAKQSSTANVMELAEKTASGETNFVQMGVDVTIPVASVGAIEESADKVCGEVASLQMCVGMKGDDGGLAVGGSETHDLQQLKNVAQWKSVPFHV